MTLTQMPHFKHAPSDNIRSSSCPCWWSSPGEAPLASPVLRCAQLRAFIPQHSSWFFRSTADARRWEHPRIIYIYIYMILERWAFEVKQTMPSNTSGFWLRPVSGQALSATRGKDALRSNQTFGLKIPNMQFIPRFYRRHFSTSKASPFCFAC